MQTEKKAPFDLDPDEPDVWDDDCSEGDTEQIVIAVPSENGEIAPHMGKCGTYEVFTIRGTEIVDKKTIETEGLGHEAIPDFLCENGIHGILCDGIGEGMMTALSFYGMLVFPGASGKVEETMKAFLNGELELPEQPSCTGSCGTCGGCCE